ncbi:hypothetical protein [Exiguobacterium sp. AB2]
MSQWFGVFQKFGKALMVPVALLPAAGRTSSTSTRASLGFASN